MRRITLWLVATVAIVVLLFSYRTSLDDSPVAASQPGGAQAPGVVSAPATSKSPTSGARSSTAPSGTAKSGATKSGTPASTGKPVLVNGSVAQTRWGPVQVQVQLTGDRITDVVTLIYPSGSGHDASINAYALPQLRQEVLSAQSAQIDGVSGATVTSDGYKQSLQAALDAAHFPG
jgi:uncharacterized protein with FMN-binding domain